MPLLALCELICSYLVYYLKLNALWDFLDTCSTFSAVCKKDWFTKVLGFQVKQYDKKIQFITYLKADRYCVEYQK